MMPVVLNLDAADHARSAPAASSRGTMVNSQASSEVANITRDGSPCAAAGQRAAGELRGEVDADQATCRCPRGPASRRERAGRDPVGP